MTDLASPDERLNAPWGCLTCSAKFRLGNALVSIDLIRCPHCHSADLQPLTGYEAIELREFHGERGMLQ